MPRQQVTIVVPFGDTHPNSCVGLLNPKGVYTEGGNLVLPSPAQKWLWERWDNYWGEVEREKKRLKAKVVAISMGDGADDNLHSKAGLISVVNDIIVKISVEVLEPVRRVADEILWIAGTPAHVGSYATIEEQVAREVTGEPLTDKRLVPFRRYIRARGVTFDCQHAPVSNSSRQHTRGSGAMRTTHEVMSEYVRRGEPLPQFALRAHVHHYEDSGINFPIRTLFCPCWKLHGEYEGKRGFVIQPVGGWYIICENGSATVVLKTYEPERDAAHETD